MSDALSRVAEMAVPEKSVGFLLWQVSRQWRDHFVAGLKHVNLSDLEFCILSGVNFLTESNEEAPTQVAIANYFNVNVMTISQLVRRLENRGLIRRKPHATDTRARALFLTEDGAHLLGEALTYSDRLHEVFFRYTDAKELRALLGELYRARKLEALTGAAPVENSVS